MQTIHCLNYHVAYGYLWSRVEMILYLLCWTNPYSVGLILGCLVLLLKEIGLNETPLQTSIGSVHSATNLNIERTTTVSQMEEP